MFKVSVIAIRIYLGGPYGVEPTAELLMSDGVVETICWVDTRARKKFEEMITGYTLIYDERPKCNWNEQALIKD